MLLPTLANKIIDEVHKLINEELIITDTTGTIIASTDPDRVGSFHEGAVIAIRDRQNFYITNELEKTLKGVKSGINLPIFFQNKVVGVIGITGNPNKVAHYGELLKKMTELLIQESYFNEQIEWSARALETFVFDWLQVNEFSSDFKNRASLLEINLNLNRQVIMAHFELANSSFRNFWNNLRQQHFLNDQDLIVRWGNDRFLLLLTEQPKHILSRNLKKLISQFKQDFGITLSLGAGKPVNAQHLIDSFNQASRALQVAKQTNTITFDDELTLEMLLQEIKEETRNEYVNRTIRELFHEHELLETLACFINENQSIKQTSESLHIHVNTLLYRLKKIEEKTNLNPRKFNDLLVLQLALLFLD